MSEGNLNESKNETLDIVNKLLNGHPDNLTLIEIKNHLLNDNSKIVGQVALWNKLAYNSEEYGNRLRGEKPNK
jgi:regulator of RNase E activity RraB